MDLGRVPEPADGECGCQYMWEHCRPALADSALRVSPAPFPQVLFAWELQRRTGGRVVSVALHPGEVMTEVVRSLPDLLRRAYRLLLQTILLTPQQGEVGTTALAAAGICWLRCAGSWHCMVQAVCF